MAEMMYAGFWRRAAALFIDLVIVGAALGTIGIAVADSVPGWSLNWGWRNGDPLGAWSSARARVAGIHPLAAALTCTYFLVAETLPWRATPGKRMLGLAIANRDGGPVAAERALARTLLKLLSILTLGLGFALAGVTRRKQALHDLIAECTVIRADRG